MGMDEARGVFTSVLYWSHSNLMNENIQLKNETDLERKDLFLLLLVLSIIIITPLFTVCIRNKNFYMKIQGLVYVGKVG